MPLHWSTVTRIGIILHPVTCHVRNAGCAQVWRSFFPFLTVVMYEFWSKYHLLTGNSNLPKNPSETSYLLNKLDVLFEMPVYNTIAIYTRLIRTCFIPVDSFTVCIAQIVSVLCGNATYQWVLLKLWRVSKFGADRKTGAKKKLPPCNQPQGQLCVQISNCHTSQDHACNVGVPQMMNLC